MPEVCDGEAYTGELRTCITKVLSFLCQKIEAAQVRQLGDTPGYIQLGVDFAPTHSTDEMMRRIRDFLDTPEA